MSFISKLNRIIKSIKAFKETYKFGGFNEINITTIENKDLLKGKRILITGGGSGIGLSMAKKFISQGANVLISGRNEDKLKNVIDSLSNKRLSYIVWDVTETNLCDVKILEANNLLGGDLDILINNAGLQPKAFFPNVTEEEWIRIYETNSKGTFFLCQAICKYWKANKSSNYRKIINISSQGGFVGATYPYRMTKWDVCGLTQGLGLAMAPYGILVNGIAPGVVKTEMQAFSLKQGNNTFCNQNLLNRVQLPDEIADFASFMISDACNFMVGQTILVDGGYSLK
jgi:3-oxoacyl-[acyl-carrier protein] reductase